MSDLNTVVADNIKKVCAEFDISTRDLASRIGDKSQKSVWNLLNTEHSPRLSTLEPVLRALMINPAAVVTEGADVSMLVSRKLTRIIQKYAKLSQADRDNLEDVIDQMLAT